MPLLPMSFFHYAIISLAAAYLRLLFRFAAFDANGAAAAMPYAATLSLLAAAGSEVACVPVQHFHC